MTRYEVLAGFQQRMGDLTVADLERRWTLMMLPDELLDLEPEEIESALISDVPPFEGEVGAVDEVPGMMEVNQ